MSDNIQVQKANGIWQEFSSYKLARFLRRIKMPPESVDEIVNKTASMVHPQTSTKEISTIVADLIKNLPNSEQFLARYNLKQSIRNMGPDGHTFEEYTGKLFRERGYVADVSLFMLGKCVKHEIDVLATKQDESNIVECKFHNREGIRSDVTIAMYVYARFLDIQAAERTRAAIENAWLVTNTKVTTDAYHYAECQGLQILNIDLPKKDGIMDRCLQNSRLMPITVLAMLSPYWIELFSKKIIILDDILLLQPKDAYTLNIPANIIHDAIALAAKIVG